MYWSKPNTQETQATEQSRLGQMSSTTIKRKAKESL
jgi:hypothetical protein